MASKQKRPVNLVLESYEISGAIKVLQALQHDWAMAITPCQVFHIKEEQKKPGTADYEWFPVTKYKHLYGAALMEWLMDVQHMRRFIYDGIDGLTFKPTLDKKGKVVGFSITD